MLIIRNLAQKQLGRFKKDPYFQWMNLAPGGQRLDVDKVAEVVAKWFMQDEGKEEKKEAWLPPEWDGTCLQNLVCLFILSLVHLLLNFNAL